MEDPIIENSTPVSAEEIKASSDRYHRAYGQMIRGGPLVTADDAFMKDAEILGVNSVRAMVFLLELSRTWKELDRRDLLLNFIEIALFMSLPPERRFTEVLSVLWPDVFDDKR